MKKAQLNLFFFLHTKDKIHIIMLYCNYIRMIFNFQLTWRNEIRENFQKMKTDGSNLPHLEEELIKRRKEELRYEKQGHGFWDLFTSLNIKQKLV